MFCRFLTFFFFSCDLRLTKERGTKIRPLTSEPDSGDISIGKRCVLRFWTSVFRCTNKSKGRRKSIANVEKTPMVSKSFCTVVQCHSFEAFGRFSSSSLGSAKRRAVCITETLSNNVDARAQRSRYTRAPVIVSRTTTTTKGVPADIAKIRVRPRYVSDLLETVLTRKPQSRTVAAYRVLQ